MVTRLSSSIPLPSDYRPRDILAFHGRDRQELAERVGGTSLQKGLVWDEVPGCLTVNFKPGQADVELALDGEAADHSRPAFQTMVRRLLGLTQGIEEFEQRYRDHPQLGALIAAQAGLRVPVAGSPFEALTWAVTGQQISLGVAVSLRRKLIAAARVRHSSGLLCYPEARQLATLSEASLRQAGFSMNKARTLLTLSRLVAENQLPLDAWSRTLPIEEMRERLLAVPGVGPWTVNYTLLRGFGWLDASLHGDVAVRRALEVLLHSPGKIGPRQVEKWLAGFSPWRALVAAHLWATRKPFGE